MVLSRGGTRDDHQTTASGKSALTHSRGGEPLVDALVIAAYPHEPARVGELAIVPSNGATVVLGRGAADDEPRMRFFRPCPGRLEPVPPLASPGLSRRQLEVHGGSSAIEVRNVGRCSLRINGVACEAATLRAGDTLTFRQELVLLCVHRAAYPPAVRHWKAPSAGLFGAADAAGIVGESPAIWRMRDELAFAAQSGEHVLFVGQSGTGKELAARAVHRWSSRLGRPLVARNAATLPSGLIDAEMFGNVKNYPNPGMPDRAGLVGQADGGLLFLDEIGDLPLELQSHLLRVLDSGGEYQRLGEATMRHADFRLLAATNRDPAELRPDLLARFAIRIEVPPLSGRREDIPLLARHILLRAAEKNPGLVGRFIAHGESGRLSANLDARFVDLLLRRDYAANTRELEAVLWKAMVASEGDVIAPPDEARGGANQSPGEGRDPLPPTSRPRKSDPPSEPEIREALKRERGNVALAAKALGLSSRYALYRLLIKLGIPADGSD